MVARYVLEPTRIETELLWYSLPMGQADAQPPSPYPVADVMPAIITQRVNGRIPPRQPPHQSLTPCSCYAGSAKLTAVTHAEGRSSGTM